MKQPVLKNWFWDPIVLILDEDIAWDSGKRGVNFTSTDGFLKIIDGIWWIKKGYKWNGCTGVDDGPPDPNKKNYPITWKASLIHDLGCGYSDDPSFPYKRREIDNYFRILLEEINFKFSDLYWHGVVFFSKYIHPIQTLFKKIWTR